ncbi:uncharacterized protein [Arachis hypogaea]|uniref:uncharacterized protein n=1 Tax=Arachis hypogaea TaxID=3818 RepID=UPI003B2219D2
MTLGKGKRELCTLGVSWFKRGRKGRGRATAAAPRRHRCSSPLHAYPRATATLSPPSLLPYLGPPRTRVPHRRASLASPPRSNVEPFFPTIHSRHLAPAPSIPIAEGTRATTARSPPSKPFPSCPDRWRSTTTSPVPSFLFSIFIIQKYIKQNNDVTLCALEMGSNHIKNLQESEIFNYLLMT